MSKTLFYMLAEDTVKIIVHKEDEGHKGQKNQKILHRQQFDEKNNLCFAIKEFYETISSGKRGNESISIQVSEVLDQILRLEAPD